MKRCFEIGLCSHAKDGTCSSIDVLQAIENYNTLKKGDITKIFRSPGADGQKYSFIDFDRKGLLNLQNTENGREEDNWYTCRFRKVEE